MSLEEKSFDEENYFLIDYQWLNKYKNFYVFLNVGQFLDSVNNININFINIDKYIHNIINLYLEKNISEISTEEISPPNDLRKKEMIDVNKNTNISKSGYLIPYKIFSIIKKLLFPNENILLSEKKIALRNKVIYLYNSNACEIIIGNLNKRIFNIKYFLIYKSPNIFKSEINKLFNDSINNYKKLRNCREDKSFSQIIKDENNKDIGKIYNLINQETQGEANKIEDKSIIDNNNDNDKEINIYIKKKNVKKNNKSMHKKNDSKTNAKDKEINNNQNSNKISVVSFGKKESKFDSNNSDKKINFSIKNIPKQNKTDIDKYIDNLTNQNNAKNNERNENLKNNNEENNLLNDINNNRYTEIISKLSEENKQLKEENKALLNELDKLKNRIKIFEEKNNIINNELNDDKEDKINEKMIKLKEKEEKINEKILELEKINISLNEEKEKVETIRLKLEQDKIENIKLKKENKNLSGKNEELENDINEKELQYQELLKKIEKIKNLKNNINVEEDEKLKKEEKQLEEALINQPILLYNSPALIGLNNIGATCFMNATLQCLSQTESLTNYFLKETNKDLILNNNIAKKNKLENQLSPSYLDLINHLWSKKRNKPYSPYEFRRIVEEMNSLFKEGQAGDSKDFIIFILEQLHNELKKPVNKNIITPQEPLNQYDKNSALNYFFAEFQKETSIISDIFFGFIETTNICQNCKIYYNSQGLENPICYNYQIFNCLIFPLEEVKNMKYNNIQMNMNLNSINNNIVDINDCFIYNQKLDYFTGENRNYCNYCRQNSDSIYNSKIYVSPNVLVLILNRGKGNIYNVNLKFYETIDISQFVVEKEKNQIIYQLYGVITHIGQSGPSAHFVSSCKSPVDNKWYRYNDSIVYLINDIQKEVIDFGTPYILFYKK